MRAYKRIKILAQEVNKLAQNFDGYVTVADIGADHGYLSEIVSKNEKISKIFATDKSQKCLDKVNKLKIENGLDKIETLCGDGLKPIEKADITVIAGIGGLQIFKMLSSQNLTETGERKCNIFVLNPSQNAVNLRKWIYDSQFEILSDFVIEDSGGQFYPIIEIDVSKKQINKKSMFNLYFGRDNVVGSIDFVHYLMYIIDSYRGLENLPEEKQCGDRDVKQKLKILRLAKKLLKGGK